MYESLIRDERGECYDTRYAQFAENLINFALDYVLELRAILPDLNRHSIDDASAFTCWAYYLSMLAIEATWSVLNLLRSNAVHIAYGLTRSLFEYLTKLEYYAQHKDEARLAYASIGERVLFHVNNYGNIEPNLIEELRSHQQQWKVNEPSSSFRVLLNMTATIEHLQPRLAKRLMTEFYETPSGFVHGSGHSMMDILERDHMSETTYSPAKTQSDACLHLLCMLHVLRQEFSTIYGKAIALDHCFTEYALLAGENLLLPATLERSDD